MGQIIVIHSFYCDLLEFLICFAPVSPDMLCKSHTLAVLTPDTDQLVPSRLERQLILDQLRIRTISLLEIIQISRFNPDCFSSLPLLNINHLQGRMVSVSKCIITTASAVNAGVAAGCLATTLRGLTMQNAALLVGRNGPVQEYGGKPIKIHQKQ